MMGWCKIKHDKVFYLRAIRIHLMDLAFSQMEIRTVNKLIYALSSRLEWDLIDSVVLSNLFND